MSKGDILQMLQLSGLNPTVPSIELALRDCGLHEREFINFRGFLKLWSRYISDVNEELMLAKAFAFFDKDDSGSVSAAEFMVTMTELGEKISVEDINLFVSLIDKNGDNEIQFDELVSALRQDNPDFAKMGEDNESTSEVGEMPAGARQRWLSLSRQRSVSATLAESLATTEVQAHVAVSRMTRHSSPGKMMSFKPSKELL
jgi:Ca2+-binding EF-hand superfamily protein